MGDGGGKIGRGEGRGERYLDVCGVAFFGVFGWGAVFVCGAGEGGVALAGRHCGVVLEGRWGR